MFEAFDAEIAARAKRAASLAGQAARLAKQLQKAAESADVHLLRQKAGDAADRAVEADAVLRELREAVMGFSFRDPSTATEVAAASEASLDAAYASAFERACAATGVPLEGNYPDYRVFPFDVRVRLREERAVIGKKSWWALRPEVLANAVKAERERLLGGTFAADKFGMALAKAYDLLILRAREELGIGAQHVALREVLVLFQLGTFGRNNYTRDEFAFDLYRFRQTPMLVGTRRVSFGDLRDAGAGVLVPNARGSHDKLLGIHVTPAEGGSDGR